MCIRCNGNDDCGDEMQCGILSSKCMGTDVPYPFIYYSISNRKLIITRDSSKTRRICYAYTFPGENLAPASLAS